MKLNEVHQLIEEALQAAEISVTSYTALEANQRKVGLKLGQVRRAGISKIHDGWRMTFGLQLLASRNQEERESTLEVEKRLAALLEDVVLALEALDVIRFSMDGATFDWASGYCKVRVTIDMEFSRTVR